MILARSMAFFLPEFMLEIMPFVFSLVSTILVLGDDFRSAVLHAHD